MIMGTKAVLSVIKHITFSCKFRRLNEVTFLTQGIFDIFY